MAQKETNKRGRDIFSKYAYLINFFVKFVSLFPKSIRLYLLRAFKNKNGFSGLGIRYVLLKATAKKCGNNVSIHPGVYLFGIENLAIGDNVSIHPMCYIDATGGIDIGNDVSIAHGTTILSSSHNYNSSKIPIKDQGLSHKRTVINDNVWIGSKATILYGIKINSGSIVAASAVITKSVEQNSIVAGVPAKKINSRF